MKKCAKRAENVQKHGKQDKIWENVQKLEEQIRQFGQMRLGGTDKGKRALGLPESGSQNHPLVTFKLVRVHT